MQKTENMLKVSYFLYVVTCYKLPKHARNVFFLAPRCLSIISVYTSPNAVFDNELFQLNGETGCLCTASVWEVTENCLLPTALDLPEDMSHSFILVLEVFPEGCCHHDLKAF